LFARAERKIWLQIEISRDADHGKRSHLMISHLLKLILHAGERWMRPVLTALPDFGRQNSMSMAGI
jgi:hypothetical protein